MLRPSEPPVLTARNIIALGVDAFYGPSFQEFADYVAQSDAQKAPRRRAFSEDDEIDFPRQATFCADWSLPVRTFAEYKALEAIENTMAPHMRAGSLGHDGPVDPARAGAMASIAAANAPTGPSTPTWPR